MAATPPTLRDLIEQIEQLEKVSSVTYLSPVSSDAAARSPVDYLVPLLNVLEHEYTSDWVQEVQQASAPSTLNSISDTSAPWPDVAPSVASPRPSKPKKQSPVSADGGVKTFHFWGSHRGVKAGELCKDGDRPRVGKPRGKKRAAAAAAAAALSDAVAAITTVPVEEIDK